MSTSKTRKRKPATSPPKTLVGVLTSRDDPKTIITLASIFTHFYHHASKETLRHFHFVFTGGTHNRLFYGVKESGIPALDTTVSSWLHNCGVTALPGANEGGVATLSYLICKRTCSLVWPLFAPNENHWLRPENLAFMRLCDQWHVKRLMNRGSILVWFDHEAEADAHRNLQKCPPTLELDLGKANTESFPFMTNVPKEVFKGASSLHSWTGRQKKFADMTIALIAHDEMKGRMIDFAIDHETELNKFGAILATGTTGREVAAATSKDIEEKMVRYHSGPKGGDIEIAMAILHDKCHVVIFFVDPLRPHPHIEDIRVVFQACMVKDQVVMITNEMHAREFMARVVRGKSSLALYT